jgi:hypothetical protein
VPRKKKGSLSQSESKRLHAAKRRAKDERGPGIRVIASGEPVPIWPGQRVTIALDIGDGRFTLYTSGKEPRPVIGSLVSHDAAAAGSDKSPDSEEDAKAIEKAERPYRWLHRLCRGSIAGERVGDELERISMSAGNVVPSRWARTLRVAWIYWLVLRDTVVEKVKESIRGALSGRRS